LCAIRRELQQTKPAGEKIGHKIGNTGPNFIKNEASGSEHVVKAIKGGETLPEAAAAAVEDLLSGSKARSSAKTTIRKAVKTKVSTKKKPAAKRGSRRGKTKP
jgi:hypothetical protein